MKANIARTVAGLLTSPRVRDARRAAFALGRRVRGGTAVVSYFHQVDDPYSHLMLQVLPAFVARHGIELQPHLALPPGDTVAPDRPRLQQWSRRDAADLAAAIGLEFPDLDRQPDPALAALADRALAALFAGRRATESSLTSALAVSDACGAEIARASRVPRQPAPETRNPRDARGPEQSCGRNSGITWAPP